MKRLLAVAVFVAVAVFSANVYAQQGSGGQGTGPYIGGHFGLNILPDPDIYQGGSVINTSYDPGLSLGGVLGYDFGMLRVDGEIALRINSISDIQGIPVDGNASAFSYMINGYFDIPTGGPVQPYVGGGIGFATVSVDHEIFGFTLADDSDSVLAYQFSAGLGFEVSPRATVSFGYRYFATDDPEMIDAGGSPFTTEYQSHEFNVGARFMF
ncbi:MAG: outer membrane beta-barrel protein [Nitrospinota bacterium]|nr:outer membrane beta-barrel protein [Nitrospinota bacterium]